MSLCARIINKFAQKRYKVKTWPQAQIMWNTLGLLLIPVVNKAFLRHLELFSSLVVLQLRDVARCARSYLLYEPWKVLELLWSIKDAMHDDDWFIAVHANTCDQQQQQQQQRAMRPCGYPWTLHLYRWEAVRGGAVDDPEDFDLRWCR